MEIVHVISSINKNSGGTSFYLKQLTESLILSHIVKVITVKSDHDLEFDPKILICSEKRTFGRFANYSFKLNKIMRDVKCDVFHGNGLWELPVHQMCKISKKRKIPYIISVHGMLEEWALNQGYFKKKLALDLFQYKDLKDAACIHCTAEMEVESVRSLGFKNPIAVIPNGVNVGDFESVRGTKSESDSKNILFLSRIHPKKGLDMLIDAWNMIDFSKRINWNLKIVGNGEKKYIHLLNEKITKLGLENEIEIQGSMFKEKKINCYKNSDLFILPSFSENFGIVVIEALAAGIPVITTKGTPWEDLIKFNAGWWVNAEVESVKNALENAFSLSSETLLQMGLNGHELVKRKYSTESVANDMIMLYEWLADKKKSKPHFIYEL